MHTSHAAFALVLSVVLSLAGEATATADTIYTYQGNSMVSVDVGPLAPCPAPCAISGYIILTTPLPPNVLAQSGTPSSREIALDPLIVSFSFTDGTQTLNNLNSPVITPDDPSGTTGASFFFSTDAQGDINIWGVDLQTSPWNPLPVVPEGIMQFSGPGSGSQTDFTENIIPSDCNQSGCNLNQDSYRASGTNSGNWTVSQETSGSAPEPSTIILFGMGLAVLLGLARQKRVL